MVDLYFLCFRCKDQDESSLFLIKMIWLQPQHRSFALKFEVNGLDTLVIIQDKKVDYSTSLRQFRGFELLSIPRYLSVIENFLELPIDVPNQLPMANNIYYTFKSRNPSPPKEQCFICSRFKRRFRTFGHKFYFSRVLCEPDISRSVNMQAIHSLLLALLHFERQARRLSNSRRSQNKCSTVQNNVLMDNRQDQDSAPVYSITVKRLQAI